MKQLKFVELRDFTGGLYTATDLLAPPNAAQIMTDCHPLPEGGLRAFYKAETGLATTGLTLTDIPVSLYTRGNIPLRAGGGKSSDNYLLMYRASDSICRLYRMDLTAVATSWSLIKTFTAGAPGHCDFLPFTLSSGTTHVYLNFNSTDSTDHGVWRIQYSDGVMTKLSTIGPTHASIAEHQARIVVGCAEQNDSRLRYSDVGSETFGSSSFIDIAPARPGSINAWLYSFAPNDLLIAKEAAGYHLIQGDIFEPMVRQAAVVYSVGMSSLPAEIDGGLAFPARDVGFFHTPNGVSFTRLSSQLGNTEVTDTNLGFTSLGASRYLGQWLFTPQGLVYDTAVEAWFRVSDYSNTVPANSMTFDGTSDFWKLLLVLKDMSGIIKFRPSDNLVGRKRTYTFKSAPMRTDDGRQISIRHVDVVLRPFASGASCTVTVGSTARAVTGISSGRQKVSYQFSEADELLDVAVVPESGSATVEAPIIEAIRVGTLPTGHLTL